MERPFIVTLEEQQRLEKRCWGFQGGMPLWSQGEAREGEAVNPKGERWKGESEAVPPPKRVVMAKSSMVASTIPKSPIYYRNRAASDVNDKEKDKKNA